MNSSNYIAILGWMKEGLELKGNELLAYALLHGFCQDQNGKKLSLNYISEWLGTTRRGTYNVLKRLQEKGLVISRGREGTPKTYRLNVGKIREAIETAEKKDRERQRKRSTPETSMKPIDGHGLREAEKEIQRQLREREWIM